MLSSMETNNQERQNAVRSLIQDQPLVSFVTAISVQRHQVGWKRYSSSKHVCLKLFWPLCLVHNRGSRMSRFSRVQQ